MATYVILDLETSGLDAKTDHIIEFAAILLENGEIIDEYETLLCPPAPIPPEVTDLTGITEEMVANAPSLFTVRAKIRKIIGSHPIVGHNVSFDLAFLHQENIATHNEPIDTLTIASVLHPSLGRYGLQFLAQELNLPLPPEGQAHRAMEDVLLTAELLLALRETASQLDVAILSEIIEAGTRTGWRESLFFEEALKIAVKNALKSENPPGRATRPALKELYKPAKIAGGQLTPTEEPDPIPEEEIAGMFQPTGNFARAFPSFEMRPQQVDMVSAVTNAFNNGRHLLIEAGTGTGKSIGYLLPAAFWATQNGRRVIVSTNTINLQDQLIHKDIPQLQAILPFPLHATVRKGRRNYLCTRLFQQMRHRGPTTPAEMTLYARLLVWLPQTDTADRAELTLRSFDERLMWDRLSAENDLCTGDICQQNRCPRYIAQRRAENAHIIIVNHALLLSDLANENHILPEFTDLIIDEAHHLEVAVTSGLSFAADRRLLERTIQDLVRDRSGLLTQLTSQTNIVPPNFRAELDKHVSQVRQAADHSLVALQELFTTITYFLSDKLYKNSQFAQQIRLTTAERTQPMFDEVMLSWDNLHKHLIQIIKALAKITEATMNLVENYDIEDAELLLQSLASALKGLDETRTNLDGILANPQDDYIYWVEVFKDRLSLHAAPLHVGPLVEEYVFHAKETVILTSATMRTAPAYGREAEPNFNYIRQRLHAQEAYELALGSPFDYDKNTLLYLASDMPEPNQPGYDRYVAQAIIDTAVTLQGRTLVLFTSYKQLKGTAEAIRTPLRQAGITLLTQTQGASRQQLTEQFKSPHGRAVLLGTRSFWEGVDIPGEALQAVLLVKIPFDVPSDPIVAARSETFDNSFFEYAIPEAILRWRQGFGRLIRRKTDEGIVLILDKRVLSKRYGQAFIDSLPNCVTIRQPTSRIPELLVRWFNRQR